MSPSPSLTSGVGTLKLTLSATDAAKWLKKYKYNLNLAMNAFFNEGGDAGGKSGKAENQKKIGEIWDKYKGECRPSDAIRIHWTPRLG